MTDKPSIRTLLENRVLVLDGAMGTMIQKEKLSEEDFRGHDLRIILTIFSEIMTSWS